MCTEEAVAAGVDAAPQATPMPFRAGLAEIWAERKARHFTFFVFLSMTAYFMQELILEPYAGLVFGLDRGGSCSGFAYRLPQEQLDASRWSKRSKYWS